MHPRVDPRRLGGATFAERSDANDVIKTRVPLSHDLDRTARVSLASVVNPRVTSCAKLRGENPLRNPPVGPVNPLTLFLGDQVQGHFQQIVRLLAPKLGHSPAGGNGFLVSVNLVLEPQTRRTNELGEPGKEELSLLLSVRGRNFLT